METVGIISNKMHTRIFIEMVASHYKLRTTLATMKTAATATAAAAKILKLKETKREKIQIQHLTQQKIYKLRKKGNNNNEYRIIRPANCESH